MRRYYPGLSGLILFLFAIFPLLSMAGQPLDKVSLQLNWKYQFEFAGYIAAKEKGFYEDVGLDVELVEYHNGIDILDEVLSQNANYGVSDFSVFIRDKKIIPVRFLASYIQYSPLVLLTSKDITSPHELLGKTIMMPQLELENSAAALMFAHFYLNKDNTNFIAPSFNVDSLLEQKADAIYAYSSNEPFQLMQKNAEFNVIKPEDYGYASQVGNLYTSSEEAQQYPERTKKFLDASTKGWKYALAHQEEIIQIIFEKYKPNKSLDALRYEAKEIFKLVAPDVIDIGTIDNKARLNFVKQLKRSGLLLENQHLAIAENDELFSLEQTHYLNQKQKITMCVDPNWLPFEAIENGKHIGIAADIFKKLQQKIPVPIRLVPTDRWHQSLEKAKNRQCDILSLAANTPSRSEYMNFTTPYINLPVVLVTKMDTFFINDIAEVKDRKVGIVKGYAMAEQLRTKIPDLNIVDVASIDEGLARVESGELFGYIDNLMATANVIQQHFTGVLKVSARLDDSVELAIGSRNDEPLLNDIFEKLLSQIKTTDLQEIYNKWVAVEQDPIIDYSMLKQVIVVFLLVSLAYLFHYIKLKKLNLQLQILSTTDKLTGLYNRVKMDAVLIEKKAELDRYNHSFSLILLDIDFFKQINDKYGHVSGDRILIAFAELLKSNIRATDFVARWGGEEFLILCPNTNAIDAMELAQKLLKSVKQHDFSEVEDLSFSAGVFEFTRHTDIEDALKNVDKALYLSKECGRNQVTVYH